MIEKVLKCILDNKEALGRGTVILERWFSGQSPGIKHNP